MPKSSRNAFVPRPKQSPKYKTRACGGGCLSSLTLNGTLHSRQTPTFCSILCDGVFTTAPAALDIGYKRSQKS
ncbi:hypothetical protein AVEN_132048-1, partial [Araneus ventricosus]